MAFFKRIPKSWMDSVSIAFAVFSVIATVLGVAGISFDESTDWITRLLAVVGAFVAFLLLARIALWLSTKNGITLNVRNINVSIKKGDLFRTDGWKLIPFNENFDTLVDDKIIAHNTLNGIFIDKHVDDLSRFRRELATENTSPLAALRERTERGGWRYPIGCIKTWRDYMLLAFTHFNPQYEAHLSWAEYERCLRQMWNEISRVYAGNPIYLPLLGGGITRFDDVAKKSEHELLKCMLCTLRTSNAHINQTITIVLTKDAMDAINLYELKGDQ